MSETTEDRPAMSETPETRPTFPPPTRQGEWLFVYERRDLYFDEEWTNYEDDPVPRYERTAIPIDKIGCIAEITKRQEHTPRVVLYLHGVAVDDGVIPVDHTLEEIFVVLHPPCRRCGRAEGEAPPDCPRCRGKTVHPPKDGYPLR